MPYTFNEVLYGNRIVTFITDGDPRLTARSMGEYVWMRSTEIPDEDGCEAAEESCEQSPRDLAEKRYRELSERVVAARRDEEPPRVRHGIAGFEDRMRAAAPCRDCTRGEVSE